MTSWSCRKGYYCQSYVGVGRGDETDLGSARLSLLSPLGDAGGGEPLSPWSLTPAVTPVSSLARHCSETDSKFPEYLMLLGRIPFVASWNPVLNRINYCQGLISDLVSDSHYSPFV